MKRFIKIFFISLIFTIISFLPFDSGNLSLANEESANIGTPNKPVIREGEMIPVKWDEDLGSWLVTAEDDPNWYNYNSVAEDIQTTTDGNGNGRWANMMLYDGVEYSFSDLDLRKATMGINVPTGVRITEPGEQYVWIPRFSYKIKEGYNKDVNSWNNLDNPGEGKIEIKFSNGTDDYTKDGFMVHPAFRFASYKGGDTSVDSNYEGEIIELTGFWVAKYNCSEYCSETDAMLSECFEIAYNSYRDADSHMMKNTEWGAVAYLTNAIGRIPCEGKRYTTHNLYGVSVGSGEFVAAYYTESDEIIAKSLVEAGNDISRVRYVDKYTEVYSSSKLGDAIFETSSNSIGSTSWDGGNSSAMTSEAGIMLRGIRSDEGGSTNMFSFNSRASEEFSSRWYDYRIVLAVLEEETSIEEDIGIPNVPVVRKGEMVPVKWSNTYNAWVTTEEMDLDWYNYNSVAQSSQFSIPGNGNGKWANVMTYDGLTYYENGNEGTIVTPLIGTEIPSGKVIATQGSQYVWIPRYSYKIESGLGQSVKSWNSELITGEEEVLGKIVIKFSNGTDDYIDSSTGFSKDGFISHQAFKFGDTELTGLWVAKYKASVGDTTVEQNPGERIYTYKARSVPEVQASFEDINEAFDIAYESYRNADSHLMKNTEWGAVVYLTNAIGRPPRINETGDLEYGSKLFITGYAGDGISAYVTPYDKWGNRIEKEYLWNDESGYGVKGSTTHNVYGIFDMYGEGEYVSAISNTTSYVDSNYTYLNKKESKYIDKYGFYPDTIDKMGVGEYLKKWQGDAMYEMNSAVYPSFNEKGTLTVSSADSGWDGARIWIFYNSYNKTVYIKRGFGVAFSDAGIYNLSGVGNDKYYENYSDNIWDLPFRTVLGIPDEKYKIEVIQKENGTITPGTIEVVEGNSQSFTITPSVGYKIATLVVDGVNEEIANSNEMTYTFNNVVADHTITATFTKKLAEYTIEVVQGENGTITPGTIAVKPGSTQGFFIKPDNGYRIVSVVVDGLNQVVTNSFGFTYTFNNINSNHEITAKFDVDTGIPNKPIIKRGEMVPVKWDSTYAFWVTTTEDDPDWYNYNSVATVENDVVEGNGAGKWANVMTYDGLTYYNEGDSGDTTIAKVGVTIPKGKVIATQGSQYVWIPRYSYMIESGYHQTVESWNSETVDESEETVGKILVKFSNGIEDTIDEGISNASEGFMLHPAFEFGDNSLTGFWVAKYEASEGNNTVTGKEVEIPSSESYVARFVPDVEPWRTDVIKNAFMYAYNTYRDADSHMMKNVEWGAVTYLSNAIGKIPYSNSYFVNSISKTGYSGTSQTSNQTTDISQIYLWNDESGKGVKASTTHNVYGVFDMSGGLTEFTAAYAGIEGNTQLTSNASSLLASYQTNGDKYVDVYTVYASNSQHQGENYKTWKNIIGDAVYETSYYQQNNVNGNGGWDSTAAYPVSNMNPIFERGSSYKTSSPGMFYFNPTNGKPSSSYKDKGGFRTVLSIPVNSNVDMPNEPVLVSGMTPIKWEDGKESETNKYDIAWYNYDSKKWANAKDLEGNYWVWIPRYTYKIVGDEVLVRWSKGTIDDITDGYNVHPAFVSEAYIGGSPNEVSNYKNFREKNQLTGFWVAKYLVSGESEIASIKPDKYPDVNKTIEEAFNSCFNMEIGADATSHLIKASEWGAVSYLSSSYGSLPRKNSTGKTGDEEIYSTTNNIYGVFDMNGPVGEYLAAFIENGDVSSNSKMIDKEYERYVDIVRLIGNEESKNNGNGLDEFYGFAMSETNYFVLEDVEEVPTVEVPYFTKGGSNVGLYGYSKSDGTGLGFRPVIWCANSYVDEDIAFFDTEAFVVSGDYLVLSINFTANESFKFGLEEGEVIIEDGEVLSGKEKRIFDFIDLKYVQTDGFITLTKSDLNEELIGIIKGNNILSELNSNTVFNKDIQYTIRVKVGEKINNEPIFVPMTNMEAKIVVDSINVKSATSNNELKINSISNNKVRLSIFDTSGREPVLERVVLKEVPTKVNYRIGEILELAGGTLEIFYKGFDGGTICPILPSNVPDFDIITNTVGTDIPVELKYGDVNVIQEEPDNVFKINVSDNWIMVSGSSNPLGKAVALGTGYYEVGETVDLKAKMVPGYRFKNWSSEDISLNNSNEDKISFEMPNYDIHVIINVEGATNLEVINPKTEFFVGDSFGLGAGYIKATYGDGSVVKLDLTSQGVISSHEYGEILNTKGTHVVNIGYGGKEVSYEITVLESPYRFYEIKVIQRDDGIITPGTTNVKLGGTQIFTITPNENYVITSVVVDNVSMPITNKFGMTYTFSNVTEGHTITATFEFDTGTPNKPVIRKGEMVPVKWSDMYSAWVTTKENDPDWYNYNSIAIVDEISKIALGDGETRAWGREGNGNGKWANVMMYDGLTYYENGNSGNIITPTIGTEIDAGKVIATQGSQFVWIPRYSYMIESGYHPEINNGNEIVRSWNSELIDGNEKEVGKILVKFSNGTNDYITSITTTEAGFMVHPAFRFAGYIGGDTAVDSNYEGEITDLTGIWVAKYELSKAEVTNTDGETTTIARSVPEVNTWPESIRMVNDIYEHSYNMYRAGDSHMIKNIEWGAVAYLTNATGKIPYPNEQASNSVYMTGYSSGKEDGSGSDYAWNDINGKGVKASTTHNIYGVFDMNGAGNDIVAGYGHDGSTRIRGGYLLNDAEPRYVDRYTEVVTSVGIYSESKLGDAMFETSYSYEDGSYKNIKTWDRSYFGSIRIGQCIARSNLFGLREWSNDRGGGNTDGGRAVLAIPTDISKSKYTITTIETETSLIEPEYKCSVCGGDGHECDVVNIFIKLNYAEVTEEK